MTITYLIPTQKPHSFRLRKRADVPRHFLRSLPLAKQCMYLGERLTADEVKQHQLMGCRSCTGEVPAFHCKLPGAKKFNDGPYTRLGDCTSCVDWQKPINVNQIDSELPRHLLFHLWPKKTSQGTWQRNLDQLKQRWPLFTGKRIIAVATSSDSHDLAAVQSYMRGYDCEWIHVENDHKLREVKTFLLLFERIEGLPGYTFYAQGKGVTKPINPGVSIHKWTAAMYEILLDYWPLVEDNLKRFPVVGVFKKGTHGFTGSRSNYHFSGSFVWLRNEELWNRNWRHIDNTWYGIESWPSLIFSKDEAGCLFHCKDHRFSLYSLNYWKRVEQELERWRSEQVTNRSSILSLTNG